VGTSEEKESLQSVHTPELGTLWISEEAEPQNTSLSAFYALISKANLFIGNESGPLQLASLSGVPLLGLFGPGVERVFYPWGSDVTVLNALGEIIRTDSTTHNIQEEGYLAKGKNKKVVIHCLLDCNPCDQVNCIHPDNPCMHRISIHQVVAILQNQFFTQ
jgi:ADP-heptose:LPS heptosyltransferase